MQWHATSSWDWSPFIRSACYFHSILLQTCQQSIPPPFMLVHLVTLWRLNPNNVTEVSF
jgi:hypothetical protein